MTTNNPPVPPLSFVIVSAEVESLLGCLILKHGAALVTKAVNAWYFNALNERLVSEREQRRADSEID